MVALVALAASLPVAAEQVPQPFPGAGSTPASNPKPAQPQSSAPRTSAPPATTPTAAAATPNRPAGSGPDIGVPIYPTAEFLDSVDAGAGQRYYLYGVNAAYDAIVTFYKTTLKNGGRELFNKTPPTQQFDLGKFKDDTMVYPPSVVVKDYTWNGSTGYLFVSGTTEKRFRTIIQIVPPPPQ